MANKLSLSRRPPWSWLRRRRRRPPWSWRRCWRSTSAASQRRPTTASRLLQGARSAHQDARSAHLPLPGRQVRALAGRQVRTHTGRPVRTPAGRQVRTPTRRQVRAPASPRAPGPRTCRAPGQHTCRAPGPRTCLSQGARSAHLQGARSAHLPLLGRQVRPHAGRQVRAPAWPPGRQVRALADCNELRDRRVTRSTTTTPIDVGLFLVVYHTPVSSRRTIFRPTCSRSLTQRPPRHPIHHNEVRRRLPAAGNFERQLWQRPTVDGHCAEVERPPCPRRFEPRGGGLVTVADGRFARSLVLRWRHYDTLGTASDVLVSKTFRARSTMMKERMGHRLPGKTILTTTDD